jgi:hypothetical protein
LGGFSSSLAGSSLSDATIGSICGLSSVTIDQLANINGTLRMNLSKSSSTFSNEGWTTLNVYLNQSDNSGSPDSAFPRTGTGSYHSGSTSFSSSSGACIYEWDSVLHSNAFGTTNGATHFIEFV